MLTADLTDRMVLLALELKERRTQEDMLAHLAQTVQELVPGADSVAISFATQHGHVTPAYATGTAAGLCDELQQALGEGPSVEAAWGEPVVSCRDLAGIELWPQWCVGTVEQLGLRSFICARLMTNDELLGAVLVLSPVVGAFDERDLDALRHTSALGAVALSGAIERDRLEHSLVTREIIGRATGLVMAQQQLPGDQAVAHLRRIAHQAKRTLRAFAGDVLSEHEATATSRLRSRAGSRLSPARAERSSLGGC